MDSQKFTLELFQTLNREYQAKRTAKPLSNKGAVSTRSEKRAERLDKLFRVAGKRVLDLGCGRGETAFQLADNYDCDVIGVDVVRYPEWNDYNQHPNLSLRQIDLSDSVHSDILDEFETDIIYSWSVMEHIRHPFRMLQVCRDLLAPDGRFLLVAHLYRSATGSHRSREVFFPWPHLLFTDDVFEQFYQSQGKKPKRPAWLNKLTYADYFRYFELLGYVVEREFVRQRPMDEAFYQRFHEELSPYAEFDLITNAVEVILSVDRALDLDTLQPNRLTRRQAMQQQPTAVTTGKTHVMSFAYWNQDGSLAQTWQCPHLSALGSVEQRPQHIRVAMDEETTFYLASRGGRSFDLLPHDREYWQIRDIDAPAIAVDLKMESGDPPELWIIQYDDDRRLCHTRVKLEPGANEVPFEQNTQSQWMRLALRFSGPCTAILGPPRLIGHEL